MDVLLCLAEHAGEVVERDALVTTIWGERAVSDEPLTRCIGELRQALGDSRSNPDYIQTVPKRGYRLLGPVDPGDADGAGEPTRALTADGPGRFQRRHINLAITIFIVSVIALTFFWLRRDVTPVTTDDEAFAATAIAVLPFVNLSGNPDEEHLSDGLADMLTHVLARIDGLRVISRTSAFAFKDKNEDVRIIGAKLRVHALLEGSVQREGDTLRITTQLVSTHDGSQLWSASYDRPTDNVFAVQDEIAAAVASALQNKIAGERVRSNVTATQSFEAYDAYLLGRRSLHRRTSESLANAVDHFESAIALDPDYALAYVGLADAYMLLNWYGNVSRPEMVAKAEPAVTRALQIDPELGEAYASQGLLHMKFDRFEEAETALQRAIALNPNYASSYFFYGTIYNDTGRPHDALRMHGAALELDPLSPVINTAIAVAHEKLGEYDEAQRQYEEILVIFPGYAAAKDRAAGLYWSALDRLDRAVRLQRDAVDVDPTYSPSPAMLALILMDLGSTSMAAQWVEYGLRFSGDAAWSLRANSMWLVYRNADAPLILQSAVEASKATTTVQQLDSVLRIARDVYMEQGEPDKAIALYETHFPELVQSENVTVSFNNLDAAVDLGALLSVAGDWESAEHLLAAAETFINTQPRLGYFGYGIADVEIYAIRGDSERALQALESAVGEGWRMHWWWETERNPNLSEIGSTPRYEAVIAGLRQEMEAKHLLVEEWPDLSPPDFAPAD